MNWFLVNSIGAIPALVSLVIFIVTSRKAVDNIRVTNALARRLEKVRTYADHSIAALRKEHRTFRREIEELDAKIDESAEIHAEIDRTVSHMMRLRSQLQQDLIRAHAAAKNVAATRVLQRGGGLATNSASHNPIGNNRNLPVFVRRRVADSPATNH